MYKIGLYEREITPLFGNSLCGYFNVRLVDGVKEKTYAKAVVIEKDDETVAMLAIATPLLLRLSVKELKSSSTSRKKTL